uniref:KEN domain-containing protein n=1 Tax=Timema douglasi TaxID=61478 RepID=A0A7R8ZC09_TIMDO|nr:unnamed protein product [Timema douglasi]
MAKANLARDVAAVAHGETLSCLWEGVDRKHHYRDLSEEAQQSLGELPNKFVDYWTERFPLLLLHSWLAMQCIRSEPVFDQYYHSSYNFNSTITSMASNNERVGQPFPENSKVSKAWMRRKSGSPYKGALGSKMIGDTVDQQYFDPPLVQRLNPDRSPKLNKKDVVDYKNKHKWVSTNLEESHNFESLNWRREDDPIRQRFLRDGKKVEEISGTLSPRWRSARVNTIKYKDVINYNETKEILQIEIPESTLSGQNEQKQTIVYRKDKDEVTDSSLKKTYEQSKVAQDETINNIFHLPDDKLSKQINQHDSLCHSEKPIRKEIKNKNGKKKLVPLVWKLPPTHLPLE